MKNIISIINKILFYSFFLLGAAIFLFDLFSLRKESALIFTFGSFIASWLLSFIINRKKIKNSDKYLIMINIALWINLLGEIMYYYNEFIHYDKVLHFTVGIIITVIVYQYYLMSLKVKKDMIFFTVLGMLAIWEIYEYLLGVFLNYPAMGVIINGEVLISKLDDTMIDLICGSIGSIIVLFIKKEGIESKIKNIKNIKKIRKKLSR